MRDITSASYELLKILTDIKLVLLQMLEIQNQKYQALQNVDIEVLSVIHEQEETYLNKLQNIEQLRMDWTKVLGEEAGFELNVSLVEFAGRLSADKAEQLLKIRKEINEIVNQVQMMSEKNAYILNANSQILIQILDTALGIQSDGRYDEYGNTKEPTLQGIKTFDHLI
ncbi:MAG: flagellar export chaperone FlgN [Brevinemataceae bacterium]